MDKRTRAIMDILAMDYKPFRKITLFEWNTQESAMLKL